MKRSFIALSCLLLINLLALSCASKKKSTKEKQEEQTVEAPRPAGSDQQRIDSLKYELDKKRAEKRMQ
jgi:preprotein translocase subunit SecG